MDDLIERLRSAAEAYPEDVFGKTTDEDRRAHGDLVQRAAATMGRHMAPLLREAAAALEAAREDAERYRFLRDSCGGGSNRAPHIFQYPAQPFDNPKLPHFKEVGLDAAIDTAREARNG